jgi:SPP1 gp7 family putative phage head morphogenesis protein
MTPPDLDALEKLHDKLNRKLAAWEKKKLAALLKNFYEAETQIKALLVTAEGWEKTRLESLLVEVDRVMDKMAHDAELWVKGRSDVSPESPLASLAQYPIIAGGNTALAAVGVTATFNMIHLPVLSYLQDYQLGLIKRITQEVREQVKEELKRGYIMGEGIPDIAKRLRNTKLGKGVWPSAQRRAEVVARTEIIRASSAGAKFVYETYGVSRIKWLAARDERICPVCGALHGKLFPVNSIPYGGPPAHPMCRCYITPSIATTEDEGKQLDIDAKNNLKWFKDKQKDGKF